MRRTKAEAARTRDGIVEAALECFDRHGIAGSTLAQIAGAARVTKGAVYHHFRGKGAILHELRERVTLPLLDEADTGLLRDPDLPALDRIERFLLGVLDTLENDETTRRTLAVMQFKCEYVQELAAELRGAARHNSRLAEALRRAYRDARRGGELVAGVDPDTAAFETLMLLSGMVRLWLLQPPGHALRREARRVVVAHVKARRAPRRRR